MRNDDDITDPNVTTDAHEVIKSSAEAKPRRRSGKEGAEIYHALLVPNVPGVGAGVYGDPTIPGAPDRAVVEHRGVRRQRLPGRRRGRDELLGGRVQLGEQSRSTSFCTSFWYSASLAADAAAEAACAAAREPSATAAIRAAASMHRTPTRANRGAGWWDSTGTGGSSGVGKQEEEEGGGGGEGSRGETWQAVWCARAVANGVD